MPPGDAVAIVSDFGQLADDAAKMEGESPATSITQIAPIAPGASISPLAQPVGIAAALPILTKEPPKPIACRGSLSSISKRVGKSEVKNMPPISVSRVIDVDHGIFLNYFRPKSSLFIGLRGKLLFAFIGISSFSVFAAITGFVVFIVARQAFEEVTATRLPPRYRGVGAAAP